MNEKRALEIFAQEGAILKNGHFVYTSGKHGSEYVNKDRVYRNPLAVDELCMGIAAHFRDFGVEVVIGPAVGGVKLSHIVAYHLTRMTGRIVISIFADKEGEELVVRRGYDQDIPGKRILIADDVFTTGGSVLKLVKLVRAMDGYVEGVGGLCNRGGVTSDAIGGVPEFYTLTSVEMVTYDEKDCPGCEAGIPINTEVGEGRKYLAAKAQKAPAV